MSRRSPNYPFETLARPTTNSGDRKKQTPVCKARLCAGIIRGDRSSPYWQCQRCGRINRGSSVKVGDLFK